MKKIFVFILATCTLLTVHAQKDTIVDHDSPYYLFDTITGDNLKEYYNHENTISDIQKEMIVTTFRDTVPRKVFGVAFSVKIKSMNQTYGEDSILWGILGKPTGKRKNFQVFDFELQDYSKILVTPEKGPVIAYNNRMVDYKLKAVKTYFDKNGALLYDSIATDTILSVYELYFDSIHSYEAGDTFLVGGYNLQLNGYVCLYNQFWTAISQKSDAKSFLVFPADTTKWVYLGNYPEYLGIGGIATTSGAFTPYNGGLMYMYSPIMPIVELRCTTPKAVRWTAIGSDTARFEWQLHDEAENFIVEVEDMIANTTTHDTLPSWQNYYTVHGLDTNTDCLQLRVQKSTRYTMKYYDTVVYSPWYELPLLGHLPEPPDTTTPIDTTQPVDTNQGILMAQGLQFSLQPNPVHDKAEVQLAAPADEGCTATLTDLSGRELQRIVVPPATQSLTIDLTTLPTGTYLLTLATPTATSTQRVVKGL